MPIRATDRVSYRIYPDDVFLCSYPRSGNTWLRYMLCYCMDPGHAFDMQFVNTIVPDLHKNIERLADVPRPRLIKSHFLPADKYPRVVYLVRDGRDVAVSYHDHQRKIVGYPFDFEHYIQDLCRGSIWPGAWHTHVLEWLNRQHSMDVLVVRYEDMLDDPHRELEKIVRFVGLAVSLETIGVAVEKSTVERIWHDHQADVGNRYVGFTGGVSGQSGKWREAFSDKLLRQFLRRTGTAMRRCGYLEGS